MDGRWLLLEQSAERSFTREAVLRRLRSLDQDRLLEVAEKLAENVLTYGQLVKQAAGRIAELEAAQMIDDAGPFPPPSEWHHQMARDMKRSAG